MTSFDRHDRKIAEKLYGETIAHKGSMTLSDIDELGRTRLFIGLRTRRLVAFVGAGLSVAFGRLDWGTLVEEAKRTALGYLEDEDWEKSDSKILAETLDAVDPSKSAENKLIALELAGEIMAGKTGNPMALHDFLAEHTSSSDSFENGRYALMEKGLEALAALIGQPKPAVSRSALQDAGTAGMIASICKKHLKPNLTIKGQTTFFPKTLASYLEKLRPDIPDFIRQDAMVLQTALLAIALRNRSFKRVKGDSLRPALKHFIESLGTPSAGDTKDAAQPVSLPNDPIDALVRIFDIRRILTTNYDQELERYLVRAGFDAESLMPKPKPNDEAGHAPSNRASDHLGGISRSAVLTEDTVADLIEFAAAIPDIAIDIFHLHGRVDLPKTIIATEDDYRRTYLRNDHRKRDFEEALEVAFSANPVLFIGLGMSEADLLRPLRQFVSDRPRDHNRPLIVLFPRSHPEGAAETERVLECKIRYGVNTILYGGDELGLTRALIQQLRRRLKGQLDPTPVELRLKPEWNLWEGLSFYRESLNYLAEFLPGALRGEMQGGSAKKALDSAARDLLLAFLQAADRQITTAALCQAVRELRRDEQENWEIWTRIPEPRIATYSTEASQIFIRHGVQHREGPNLIDAVIRTRADRRFDKLTKAVRAIAPQQHRRRRRIIIVAADPGVGRGRTFWRLHDAKEQRKLLSKGKSYHRAFAATTSFSWEFSSAIDFMIQFLAEGGDAIEGRTRLERLRRALDNTREWKSSERRLLVLSGLDVLLDRDGNPFGGEYAEIFPMLFDVRYESAPIDIVLIVKPQHSSFDFLNRCLTNHAADRQAEAEGAGDGDAKPGNSLDPENLIEISDLEDELPIIENTSGILGLRLKSLTMPDWSVLSDEEKASTTECLALLADSTRSGRKKNAPTEAESADVYGKILSLRDEVGESGFANSAAAAALLSCVESGDDGSRVSIEPLAWLDRLTAKLSTRDPRQRRGCCVSEILRLYNAIGAPAERSLRSAILRHLAVMGIPVESHVLERCPKIREILDESDGISVKSSLTWLVEKRLVFEIISNRSDQLKDLPRFALHRLVQAEILRDMGCPRREGGETNFFQVSLYAAQPTDLPSLNETTYDFLCEMIDALIEQRPSELDGTTRDKRRNGHKSIENVARCLRAAFGIIRASMSVAVISRLDVDVSKLPDDEPGLFQSYKYRLRALTRRQVANDLAYGVLGKMSSGPEADDVPDPPLRSLYTDELIWNYNERGVASLSQGQLYDAQPLFRLALKASGHGDPATESATTARINLNLAIVYIERGRLRRAQELLRQVRDQERRRHARTTGRERDTLVSTLAKGYLGLISHLSGRLVEAAARYDEVIAKLSGRDRPRGVAIFCRHLANLYAAMGRTGLAKQAITRAITSAQAGRHQDILHMARVTAAKLEQSEQPARALEWLENAERYAEFMDMPNLKTEVLFARGELFLAQGENRLAGEMATQALAIASRYGMVLRRISTLVLLGKIAQRRGNRSTATSIFHTAGMLAERAGYHLKVEITHQLKLPSIDIVSIDSTHLGSPSWQDDQPKVR